MKDLVISPSYVHCLTAFVISLTFFGGSGTLLANFCRMHSKETYARFAEPFFGYRVSFMALRLFAVDRSILVPGCGV